MIGDRLIRMAKNEPKVEAETTMSQSRGELKHLGVVRETAIQVLALAGIVYEWVKLHSGPLRPPLSLAKDVVVTVFGPFYRQFKDVPDRLLLFLDSKLDEAIKLFDRHAPSPVKWVVHQYLSIIQMALELAPKVVHKAWVDGPTAAILYAITEFNQFLISLFMKFWFSAIKIPPFQFIAGMALPMALSILEKYNQGLTSLAKLGFTALGNLPSVPIDKIGDAFKLGEEKFNKGITNVVGGITNVMDKGSSALSSVPIVGDASKVAGMAASAAQNTITNVVEMGSSALSSAPVLTDPMKVADAAASTAQKTITNVVDIGSSVIGSVPVIGVADAAASTAQKTINNVVDIGSSVIGSVPVIGEASKVTDAAASAAKSTINNVDNVVEKGSSIFGIVPIITGASKAAAGAAASAAENTIENVNNAVEKGSSIFGSIPILGEATKVAGATTSTAHKTISNVRGKFRLP